MTSLLAPPPPPPPPARPPPHRTQRADRAVTKVADRFAAGAPLNQRAESFLPGGARRLFLEPSLAEKRCCGEPSEAGPLARSSRSPPGGSDHLGLLPGLEVGGRVRTHLDSSYTQHAAW